MPIQANLRGYSQIYVFRQINRDVLKSTATLLLLNIQNLAHELISAKKTWLICKV
jgi:hypothetical protein